MIELYLRFVQIVLTSSRQSFGSSLVIEKNMSKLNPVDIYGELFEVDNRIVTTFRVLFAFTIFKARVRFTLLNTRNVIKFARCKEDVS